MRIILALLMLTLAGPAFAQGKKEPPQGDPAGYHYDPSQDPEPTDSPSPVYSEDTEGQEDSRTAGDTDGDGRLSDAEDAAAHPAYGPSSLDKPGPVDTGKKPEKTSKPSGDGPGGKTSKSGGGKNVQASTASAGSNTGNGKQAGDGPGGK